MRLHPLALALALACTMPAALAEPFTFQGYVESGGSPIDGDADLTFRIYDAASGGSQLGNTVTETNYPVADGVFTIDLDAGTALAFDGDARFLEVEVNGQTLSPRLEILPAPLASSSNALRGRAVSDGAPASGNVLTWTGTQWAPQAPSGGGGGSYSAGIGLNLVGTTFHLLPSYQLPQGCATGQIARALVGFDGSGAPIQTWVCDVDAGSSYTNGPGLLLNGTEFSVNFAGDGAATSAARSDHQHMGQTWSGSGAGLTLQTTDAVPALRGESSTSAGTGVSGDGRIGVHGTGTYTGVSGAGTSFGVDGTSESGTGVSGTATGTSGATTGVLGWASSPDGFGVRAVNDAAGGTALIGDALAASGNGRGVLARAASSTGVALRAENTATSGEGNAMQVVGNSEIGDSLTVEANGSQWSYAIVARSAGNNGRAVYASLTNNTSSGVAVYGYVPNVAARAAQFVNAAGGEAARFEGNVNVLGNHTVSGSKSFRIDHPLDPENRYLLHYNLEGPEPFNLYRGTVKLDMAGAAEIELPEYFESINIDLSYQLTAVGAAMPNLHVAREVQGNRFAIAGGAAGERVSWQVTAVRNDPWVRDRGFAAEIEKPAAEKGRYLFPEGYGQPPEKAIGHELRSGKPGAR